VLEGDFSGASPDRGATKRAPTARRCVKGIVLSEALAAEGAVVFAKACELGLEGIVSKPAGSFYKSGRSRNWLKTINPKFVRT
jgi:ATP-dependent DNA ligase